MLRCKFKQIVDGSLAGKVILKETRGRGEVGSCKGIWEKIVPSREQAKTVKWTHAWWV